MLQNTLIYWFVSSWFVLKIKTHNFEEKIGFFYPSPPQRGVLKKLRYWKLVGESKFQNMICSIIIIIIRFVYKISVLYLQNQASYSNFSLVNMMRNLNFTTFWNPEISLKFWDLGPNICMWPLNIQTNKCYIATRVRDDSVLDILGGASEAP